LRSAYDRLAVAIENLRVAAVQQYIKGAASIGMDPVPKTTLAEKKPVEITPDIRRTVLNELLQRAGVGIQFHFIHDEWTGFHLTSAHGRTDYVCTDKPWRTPGDALAQAVAETLATAGNVPAPAPVEGDDRARRYNAVCDILDELKLAVFDASDGAIRDNAMKWHGKALRKTGNTVFNVGVTPEYALAWYVLRVMERGA
jgi:hypothetical protein